MSPDFYIQKNKHKREVDKIIIHCTATKENDNSIDAEWVDRLHRRKGWAGCGYHFIVKIDGEIEFENCRHISKMGAHVKTENKGSIGISYVGGVLKDGKTPSDTRTPEQKESLLNLLESLRAAYPDVTIHGHNEFSSKACPSFSVPEQYPQFMR
jgi:N-acetylmuramoyl-L-alanine amidase